MRRIKFDAIDNFRDLGGYQTPFGQTCFGVIYRSASLDRASKEDVDKIAELGIKTVIDFRDKETAASKADAVKGDPRFKYINIPVNGGGRIPIDHQDAVDSYLEMLEDPYSARTILKAFLNEEKPLLFHCSAGKDRTGCFTMILMLLNEVDFDDINADYMLSFPYLFEQTVIARENNLLPDVCLTPDIFMLKDVYDAFIERYGNVISYCEHIGLTSDEVDGLSVLLGKQEKSCGAVIFNEGKVLIDHSIKGHYTIPKGHVEPMDKDEHATAVREIKEETGLDITFVHGWTSFTYHKAKDGVIKKDVFFIAESLTRETKKQDSEVASLHWLSVEDALTILTHQSDREIIVKAANFYYKKKKRD